MKRHIGTKLINAMPMSKLAYNETHNRGIAGEDAEGYLVQYHDANGVFQDDGYFSWSPKDVFEAAYRQIDTMTFGLAIEALKQGKKVTRTENANNEMFVYLVPADKYNAKTDAAKSFFGEDGLVPYNAYLAIKHVNGTVSIYQPNVEDVLAEDWQIVE